MVTLSRHTSFQDGVFSMYDCLKDKYVVYTITIDHSSYPGFKDANNFYVNAPLSPALSKAMFRLGEIRRMIKIVKNHPVDCVYFESFHIWNYPIILYCKRNSIPYAHCINDVIDHIGDRFIFLRRFIKNYNMKLANRIILRSEDGYNNAAKKYPQYISKMHRVDLWYSFPEYKGPEGKTVLFFGRINKYKGIDNLCKIIQATPKIRYVVAGKADDSVKEELEQLKTLKNVTVDEGIIPYPKMHDYFYNACCIILPYKTATQSGVILDAYRHSRPVVAFDVGALGEEIENGVTGYSVPQDDLKAMIERIKEIVNMDEEPFTDICKKSYNYGLKRYSAQSRQSDFLKAIGIE